MIKRTFHAVLLTLALAAPALAQESDAPLARIRLARGQSTLIEHAGGIARVSVANPEIADAIVISANELQLNAKQSGSTTLILWGRDGARRLWIIESEIDASEIERMLARLFPEEKVEATAAGGAVVLSGTASSEVTKAAMVEAVRSTGVEVVANLREASPRQVMLQVRFAEVSRSAVREMGTNLLSVAGSNGALDANGLERVFEDGSHEITLSDAVSLAVFDPSLSIGMVIRALSSKGKFHSLAEPNLIALEGQEAQFLAGGEFPFPVAQGTSGGVTIQFKEFGVRLVFKATPGSDGRIRLDVAPEVSSLDFGNAIESSGFRIPSILTRRAHTVVELEDGQTFAVAGLLNQELTNSAEKIPLLGSVPILGRLFQSKDIRERQTELLVLVTPRLVSAGYTAPALPGGESSTWEWSDGMRENIHPKNDAKKDEK